MPVWEGGSVGERCVGKRRRRQSASANDMPGRQGTGHRRAIGIIVPVVALIHADGLNSESQRGSAPRPETNAAFASGCRGEFENPALRFCKEYIPEMPLGKAGQTLRGNSVSRVSTVSRRDSEEGRVVTVPCAICAAPCPSRVCLQRRTTCAMYRPDSVLVCHVEGGSYFVNLPKPTGRYQNFVGCRVPCLNETLAPTSYASPAG